MRIIAGRFRSRKLKPVPGLNVRPTADRLREALFNVLAPEIEGTVFLDAYAGTGAVGLEALSRGARHAIFIEKHPAALAVLRDNIAALGLAGETTVLRGSAARVLSEHPCDIAFIDPPYDLLTEYQTALQTVSCPLAIAQHASRIDLEERYGTLTKSRVLKHGSNALTFFHRWRH